MKKTINFTKMKSILLFMLLISSSIFAQVNLVATEDASTPMANDGTFNYTLVAEAGASTFDAIRIKLTYNPAVLELLTTSIPKPAGLDADLPQDLSVPGTIRFEAGVLGGTVTRSVDIFTIQFKLLDETQTVNINHALIGSGVGYTTVLLAGTPVLGTTNNISFDPLADDGEVDLVAAVTPLPPHTIGQQITYTLTAEAGTATFNSLSVYLEYDPAVIDLVSFTQDLSTDFQAVDTSVDGIIKFSGGNFISADYTGSNAVFTIEFDVLDNTQNIVISHNYNPTDGTFVPSPVDGSAILGTANDINLNFLNTSSVFKNSIAVYPNPAKENLFINLNKSTEAIKGISLYSVEGKLIKSINNVSNYNRLIKVDTKGLNEALYFMTITSENDNKATYKVLVKQ